MVNHTIKIGINGSMLDNEPTGVGIYSFNLINHLFAINQKKVTKDFTVFTPSDLHLNKDIRTVKLSRYLLSSRYKKLAAACRFFWNTFFYPFQARKFSLLINPTTHGSLFLNNQIFTIHDLISLRYKNILSHQRFYFRYILPIYIKRARLIIAISESTKKDIIHYFNCPPEKIKVLHNGYDEALFIYDSNPSTTIAEQYGVKDYLLAVGPNYAHKNFELLVRVYHQLPDNYKARHPLVIAGGKDPYLQSLKNIAESLSEKTIYFLGYVPLQFMPHLYKEAFAFIFPSLYEGFGIPLLEAMASGCPVIASNTSSVPEVCGNAVLYFDPLERASLCEAIRRLSEDELLRNELRSKGLLQVKKFSWLRMAEKFSSIIDTSFQHN